MLLRINSICSEQSRRDDLESLGYMLVYFLKGSLPWQGLKAATKNQKYEKILESKVNTSLDTLCKGIPGIQPNNIDFTAVSLFLTIVEFKNYFECVRSLRFDDRPDYNYLRSQFRELFFRKGFSYDNEFDWQTIAELREPQQPQMVPNRANLLVPSRSLLEAAGESKILSQNNIGNMSTSAELPALQEHEQINALVCCESLDLSHFTFTLTVQYICYTVKRITAYSD